jgi:hypothetical protein
VGPPRSTFFSFFMNNYETSMKINENVASRRHGQTATLNTRLLPSYTSYP